MAWKRRHLYRECFDVWTVTYSQHSLSVRSACCPTSEKFILSLVELICPICAGAFKAVKRNRGAAGVDKVDIRAFEANLEQNLAALMFDLKYPGRYHASPLRRVFHSQRRRQTAPVGHPHRAGSGSSGCYPFAPEPIFEPLFSESSFGFRPGRSAHQAIQAVTAAQKRRYSWVVDADIQSFFDTIPHDLIINLVGRTGGRR